MAEARTEWTHLVHRPEEEWDLFEFALQLCRMVAPESCLEAARAQVDAITSSVRSRLTADSDAYTVIEHVNQVLFEELGFQGDVQDYYNPANSFLTQVLTRRRGIPISLSLLYREIASRLGLRLLCVTMPGHFLLKYRMPLRDLFLDPYNQGEILLEEECRERFDELYAPKVKFEREFLHTAGNRQVVLRMLMNLKQIYKKRHSFGLLLEILERRVPLLEDPLPEILERGLVHLSLEQYRSALKDLEHFVAHTPDNQMRLLISQQLAQVRLLAHGN